MGTRPAGGRETPRTKTIRHGGARLQTTVEAAVLAEQRDAAVARKVALFGEGPGWRAAAASAPRPDRPARGRRWTSPKGRGRRSWTTRAAVRGRPGWRHGAGPVDGPRPRCAAARRWTPTSPSPSTASSRPWRGRTGRRTPREGPGRRWSTRRCSPRAATTSASTCIPAGRGAPSPGVLVARAARATQPGVSRRRRSSGR